MEPKTPLPICALDLETDGLHPGRRVWEYAAIRRDYNPGGGWTETTTHAFVALDLRNSDPFGLRIGAYWDRHPMGRKISGAAPLPGPGVQSKHEAAGELMKLTFGAAIVGVNPAFDTSTLAGLLRAEGYIEAWDHHLVDLPPMAVGWLNARYAAGIQCDPRLPARPPWKSDDLSYLCGVNPPTDGRHTALGDARWALDWYDVLVDHPRAEVAR
jgi:hypothetical protein